MSASVPTALPPVWPRAALVLLVTLLVHALMLERMQLLFARAQPVAPIEGARVTARLLAPPAAVEAPAAQSSAVSRKQATAKPRPQAAALVPPAAPAAPMPASPSEPALLRTTEATADALAPLAAGEPEHTAAPDTVRRSAPHVAVQDTTEPDAAATTNAERALEADVAALEFDAVGPALQRALARLPSAVAALPTAARYVYRTTYSELSVIGSTVVDWAVQGDRYRLRMATTTLGRSALELESKGTIRAFGLAPERYAETGVRRGTVAANFDWEGRRVTFSARTHERPLPDGVQDRISFQFQLMLLGQAAPERFRSGAETVMEVAGRDDVARYRFRSAGHDRTVTGMGEVDTVRVERLESDAIKGRIDVWLAPDHGWLPVRLRFTDRHGRFIESVLESAVPA